MIFMVSTPLRQTCFSNIVMFLVCWTIVTPNSGANGKLTEFHCQKYCNATCKSYLNSTVQYNNCVYSKAHCDCNVGQPMQPSTSVGQIVGIAVGVVLVGLGGHVAVFLFLKAGCYKDVLRRKRRKPSEVESVDNQTFSTFPQIKPGVDFVVKSKPTDEDGKRESNTNVS